MKMKVLAIAMAATALFSACKDEEEAVELPGDLTLTTLSESIYTSQQYYNLIEDKVVQSIDPDSWDLGFDNEGVITNPGAAYGVYKTSASDFATEITIPEDAAWSIDKPDGSVAGRAFYNLSSELIYVLGANSHGKFTPAYSVKISKEGNKYTVEYAAFGEAVTKSAQVTLNSDVYYTHFSLESGSVPQELEPAKGDWQLLFTPYTTVLESGNLYPVKGVVLNPDINFYKEIIDFTTVDKAYAETLTYAQDQEGVGYKWKSYTDGTYVTDSETVYILKDTQGNYFKLRFIDFFNTAGEKGYPSFEFQKL